MFQNRTTGTGGLPVSDPLAPLSFTTWSFTGYADATQKVGSTVYSTRRVPYTVAYYATYGIVPMSIPVSPEHHTDGSHFTGVTSANNTENHNGK
ncbi:Hypothetical predicted protein [Octopus vulgaris]|uniref:Uncharacterized protein n=1 Tax=Octopus vulgaris TaxID=6645 RepID=A0AA36EXX4_OCTVU|nr:Hypothetical predicted protein [Octopus vulgaris]